MTGIGHSTSHAIQDGRWIALDLEQDQFLEDGTFVLTWQLHWVSGWDPEHGPGRLMAPHRGIHHGAAAAVSIRLSRHTQPDVPRSPDDQDRAVSEVDHLVRRAAQDQAR
jgi:hypothetical protein